MRVIIKPIQLGYLVIPPKRKDAVWLDDYFLQEKEALLECADILRLTKRDIRALDGGRTVTKLKIDEWEFNHGIVGYSSS